MKTKLLYLLLLSFVSMNIYAFQTDELNFVSFNEEEKTVSVRATFASISGIIEIPETITVSYGKTYTVTAIDIAGFVGCSEITGIKIPNTIKSIGERAFYNCNGITEINIPGSVQTMGSNIFLMCRNLKKINVDKSNSNFISDDGVLYTKDKSTLIIYPAAKDGESYIIGNNTQSIEDAAFAFASKLKSVTVSNSIKILKTRAFYSCLNLTSFTIPSSVTSIANSAFTSCYKLQQIIVDNNNPNYLSNDGVLYSKDKTELVFYPEGKESEIFEIPEGTKDIKGNFFSCDNLKKVIIPNSITTLKALTFNWCENLEEISISASVTNISPKFFSVCQKISNIYVNPNNPNYISENGILYSKDKTVLKSHPSGHPQTSFDIPEGVQIIDSCAFMDSRTLTQITIPSSVSSIKQEAFNFCTNLSKITIPKSVISIEDGVFMACMKLSEITVMWESPLNVSSTENLFRDINEHAILYVPKGTSELYKAAPVWKEFDIREQTETSIESNLIPQTAVHPTLVSDYFNVSDVQGATVTVSNMQGHIIYKKANISADERIETSHWRNGVYLVSITHNNSQTTYKVIKK